MPETKKRLVVCCDGTWNSTEQHHLTNVVHTARALRPTDDQGVTQVVFYDWGIGSNGDKVRGGMLGAGIDKNIQDAYRFLVHNYSHGDEILLFGFSRGAYTARSLAGLIRNAGRGLADVALRWMRSRAAGHGLALVRLAGCARVKSVCRTTRAIQASSQGPSGFPTCRVGDVAQALWKSPIVWTGAD